MRLLAWLILGLYWVLIMSITVCIWMGAMMCKALVGASRAASHAAQRARSQ